MSTTFVPFTMTSELVSTTESTMSPMITSTMSPMITSTMSPMITSTMTSTMSPSMTSTMSPSMTSTMSPMMVNDLASSVEIATVNAINDLSVSSNLRVPQDIQKSISNLYDNLSNLNNSSISVMNGQNTLNAIIDNETQNINEQLQSINTDLDSSKRILQLNEYSRMKTADYNSILYYIIALMVTISLLFIIKKLIPGIPNMFFELTLIFIIFLCIYFVYQTYLKMYNRDVIYYDQIAVPHPKNINLDQNQINSVNAGNGINISNINNCEGSGCCDEETTVWDPNQRQCVSMEEEPIPLSGTSTTRTPTSTSTRTPTSTPIQGFTLMESVQPNSYFEFSNYSIV